MSTTMNLVYLTGRDSEDKLTRYYTTTRGVIAHKTGIIDPRNEDDILSLDPPTGGRVLLRKMGSVWSDNMTLEVIAAETIRITVKTIDDWKPMDGKFDGPKGKVKRGLVI
jgi:hypothetical protein